ncbi:hypothetical protein PLESTF_000714100 [Pleodorina starrii]|nr:hypothetical protein PLESTM_001802900 [Pleodorina starrii]GLC68613.1 hypothetical protein PLESTF_000714100 [Pleodorina starrii]
MLLLVAALGFAFWEARRRRTSRSRKGRATTTSASQTLSAPVGEWSSVVDRASDSSTNGSWLQLKQELSALSPDIFSTNAELLARVLREGEAVLPQLCDLLKASSDGELLADATELLALLSPSRRGLQAAICESGAVAHLLRLLALAHPTPRHALPHPTAKSLSSPPSTSSPSPSQWLGRGRQPQSLTQIPIADEQGWTSRLIQQHNQEKGQRLRRVASAGGADLCGSAHICSNHGNNNSGSSCGSGGSSGLPGQANAGAGAGAGAGIVAVPTPTGPGVLSNVLRTLVNLTSNARTGNPVRQALLRDPAAMDALMALLHVPEEDEGEGEGGAAWQGWGSRGGRAAHTDAAAPSSSSSSGEAEAAAAADGRSPPAAAAVAAVAVAGPSLEEARWHIAGLAAWLVAHLCSNPMGQLQLMQGGVVPALVRLVRHGRMAWATAAAEGIARRRPGEGGVSASAAAEADGDAEGRAERERVPYTRTASRLLPHASSALLYDAAAAAAAAAAGSPRASAVPYMIAAVQYSLMALVNLTFDNSPNQRSVARAGMLSELEALFAVLLQRGVLLPRPPSSWSNRVGGTVDAAGPWAAAVAEAGELPQQQRGRRSGSGSGEAEPSEGEYDGEAGGGGGPDPDGGGDDDDDGSELEFEGLLRSGYLGVGKFAVWLLAHLSSSDPDLKADIAGPAFSFVPRLLQFVLLPDSTQQQQQPDHHHHHHYQQHQQVTRGQAGPAGASEEQQRTDATAHPADAGGAGFTAAASGGVLVVRQYAAMALVNLTCGVPSTKAVVARALDWDGMVALMQWLAEEKDKAAAAAAEPAEPAPRDPAAAAAGGGGVSGPVSDLLLYTVWLLQHLSLSPFAAAAADPRVVSPLVSLLDAPDPHVRLRAAAAIGALCSAPLPTEATSGGTAAAAVAAGSGVSLHSPQPQQPQPHRAAFLAAGGVQRLLAAARRERDPHLLAYGMLCLSSAVGDDNVAAVAEAVGGGALRLLEGLMASEHPACLLPAAEALQALSRAARLGLRRHSTPARASHDPAAAAAAAEAAAAAAVAAAVDYVPRSLLARVVAIMLTHSDPGVRAAMNEALGAVTALPGVRERYCAVFAETLRDLVSAAEVELQVIPVN